METTTQLALDETAPALEPIPDVTAGRRWVSDAQLAAIRSLDHFGNSIYGRLDLNGLLNEYMADFVEPLLRLAGAPRTVADVGAGYGWLALAFALRTDAEVTAIEYNGARLAAARRIAAILGVEDRITWLEGSVASLPLADRSMDAVYCVEVIEHTGVHAGYVAELCRISRDVLVITTPNKLFPVINHDTALPFCHWLPLRARDLYAAAFRRGNQDNNQFWSPAKLLGSVTGFRRVSSFMQFDSYDDYRASRAAGAARSGFGRRCLNAYLALAARLGKNALYVLPNLASTFRRVE
jgi:SAM-dependent methyltransferase